MILKDEIKFEKISEHVKKIEYLRYVNNNIMNWDKATTMPSKSLHFRSEVMSFLAGELYILSENKELIDLVNYFLDIGIDKLDIKSASMIRRIKRNHDYINRIPKEEYKDYIYHIANTEQMWSSCKKEDDFETLVPQLEKTVEHFKNFAEYWGYDENPYDALLAFYETGVTVKMIDPMFSQLRDFIINTLKKISTSKVKINKDIFKGSYNKNSQSRMTKELLQKIGFDFEAGRVDEGDHPTILSNFNKDVRIITAYNESNFLSAFTTALHAGGQGLYEQGIGSDLYGTLLAEPSSMVMLEAIARFYENMFGKSKEFCDFYFPKLVEYFPALKEISNEEFFEGINKVEKSFIRIDADELTYNLHIIIRYEIEKDLINNKLEVKDIPTVWNQKFKEYFGMEPPNHSLGALQDVHWFSGYFGYFPSYILGNFYAAQIYATLKKEKPEYDEIIASGDWGQINEWLKEKIFSHGSVYNPQELIYIITDENLKVDYFMNYLEEKYKAVYKI